MTELRSWEDVMVYIGRQYSDRLDELVFGECLDDHTAAPSA